MACGWIALPRSVVVALRPGIIVSAKAWRVASTRSGVVAAASAGAASSSARSVGPAYATSAPRLSSDARCSSPRRVSAPSSASWWTPAPIPLGTLGIGLGRRAASARGSTKEWRGCADFVAAGRPRACGWDRGLVPRRELPNRPVAELAWEEVRPIGGKLPNGLVVPVGWEEIGVDRRIAWIAERQGGLATRAQLIAAGLSHDEIDNRIRQGRLHIVFRGVYAVGHPLLAPFGDLRAATLACGERSLVSHRTGTYLWGMTNG